jgi:hypothetical protein
MLTQSKKDIIFGHWGKTLGTLKDHLNNMGRIKSDEILRVVVYLIDTPEISTTSGQLSSGI